MSDESIKAPDHYADKIQPVEYLQAVLSEEEFRGWLRGNCLKYWARYRKKNGVKDLLKATRFLEWLIAFEEGQPLPLR